MKYLADENVAAKIVEWLRNRGDDVRYAADERPGEVDSQWLSEAEAEQRLILTSDKDFGDLVFRDRLNSHGVVLLRLKDLSLDQRLRRLEHCWSAVEANSSGSFIVITRQRVRVRPIAPSRTLLCNRFACDWSAAPSAHCRRWPRSRCGAAFAPAAGS